MFKRVLVVGSLLLLVLGFVLVPAQVAHADTCNGSCGQDPYVSGCAVNGHVDVIAANEFTYGNAHWLLQLQYSTTCYKVWASLLLESGNNGLYNARDLEVFSIVNGTERYDILYSSRFYNGAYTNMIENYEPVCAYYDGAYVTPSYPSACFRV